MNRLLVRAKLFSDWRVVMVKGSDKYTPGKKAPEKIPMAVNTLLDRFGSNFTYIDLVLFGSVAEKALETSVKGDQVEVKGYLKQITWTDKDTGKKRNKLQLTGKTFEKLDPSKEWDIGPNEMAPWEGAEEE